MFVCFLVVQYGAGKYMDIFIIIYWFLCHTTNLVQKYPVQILLYNFPIDAIFVLVWLSLTLLHFIYYSFHSLIFSFIRSVRADVKTATDVGEIWIIPPLNLVYQRQMQAEHLKWYTVFLQKRCSTTFLSTCDQIKLHPQN